MGNPCGKVWKWYCFIFFFLFFASCNFCKISGTFRAPEKKDGRSWSSTSNLFKGETNEASLNAAGWNSVMDLTAEGMDQISTNSKNARPKTYAGSQSDTYNLRRHSYNEDLQERPQKLQIRNVISKTNGTSSNTDAEFIIQVIRPVDDRNLAKLAKYLWKVLKLERKKIFRKFFFLKFEQNICFC